MDCPSHGCCLNDDNSAQSKIFQEVIANILKPQRHSSPASFRFNTSHIRLILLHMLPFSLHRVSIAKTAFKSKTPSENVRQYLHNANAELNQPSKDWHRNELLDE
jgi:hypothetical protein